MTMTTSMTMTMTTTTRGDDDDDDGRALDLRVMTFGAPHVGDAAFAAFAEATLGADRARFQRRGAVLSLFFARGAKGGRCSGARGDGPIHPRGPLSHLSRCPRDRLAVACVSSPRAVVAVRFCVPRWHEGLCC